MVSVSQGGLAVDGIVDTAEQRQAVLKVLENAPGRFPVARHVSVATELAESIRSALGVAGASVSYRGGGVFRVAVDSADVAGTQAALARVAADLAPVVKHIEADVHEITTQAELPATRSSMTTDGVSVKETRDGVKHLVLTEPEQDATVIAELPIAPPTAAVPSSRAKP
jgi:type III secretion protein D